MTDRTMFRAYDPGCLPIDLARAGLALVNQSFVKAYGALRFDPTDLGQFLDHRVALAFDPAGLVIGCVRLKTDGELGALAGSQVGEGLHAKLMTVVMESRGPRPCWGRVDSHRPAGAPAFHSAFKGLVAVDASTPPSNITFACGFSILATKLQFHPTCTSLRDLLRAIRRHAQACPLDTGIPSLPVGR